MSGEPFLYLVVRPRGECGSKCYASFLPRG
uniref:Uncharacterized protein n=1 Tax=virus sp. ctVE78 TaxID=2826804 RepID=A0A8S5R7D4_9VIRU|nr:MAG TPA: hypothetical protein [virus sp. ctVE78]